MTGDENRKRGRDRTGKGRTSSSASGYRRKGRGAGADDERSGSAGRYAAALEKPLGAYQWAERVLHQLNQGGGFDWEREFGSEGAARMSAECREALEALMKNAPLVAKCIPPQRFRALVATLPDAVLFNLVDAGDWMMENSKMVVEKATSLADLHPLVTALLCYLHAAYVCIHGPVDPMEVVALMSQPDEAEFLVHCLRMEYVRRVQAFDGVMLPDNPFGPTGGIMTGPPVPPLIDTIQHPGIRKAAQLMAANYLQFTTKASQHGMDTHRGPAGGSRSYN